MNRSALAIAAVVVLAGCAGSAPATLQSTIATSPPTPVATTAEPSVAATAEATAAADAAILAGEPWIAFQGDNGGGMYGVRLIRPDGTGLFFPTDRAEGREQLHPDWSPDGSRLVFSTMGAAARDLWVTDADGGNPEHIVSCDTCSIADEPAWSPDGTSIAFHRHSLEDDWVSTLEIYDIASKTSKVVFTTPRNRAIYAPRWSPDGTKIVAEYLHRRDGATDLADFDRGSLAIIDLTAAKPTPRSITDASYWPANPDWSPDGTHIVFFRPVDPEKFDAEADLWAIKPDGTGLTQLTHYADDHAFAIQPTYTPDGSRIAFVTAKVDAGAWVMATIASDGSDPRPATSSGYIAGVHPRFRPTP